jgi:hypothetical protein
VPASGGELGLVEPFAKGLENDGVVPHQADIDDGGGDSFGVLELLRWRGHGGRRVDQHPDGGAGFELEELEEHLLEPHEGAPIDGAEVVAGVEVPVVEELESGACITRGVVAADETAERLLPTKGEPLKPFKQGAVKQLGGHRSSSPPALCTHQGAGGGDDLLEQGL